MAQFTDGLSNTILVGEKAFDPSVQGSDTWYWDEPFFLGGSEGTSRGGQVILLDGSGIPYKDNWGAAHPGGAQFLSETVQSGLCRSRPTFPCWLELLTPNGGEPVTLP